MLKEEIRIFNDHLSEWLKSHTGKFVLIKGEEVIGFYNTDIEALSEGARLFGLEPFLVRPVIPVQEEVEIPAMMIGVLNANPTQPIRW